MNMEASTVYRGYIGITEKKLEATIVYWDLLGYDDGKENGGYYSISGFYVRILEKENGSYHRTLGLCIGIMENEMEATIVYLR